MNFWRVVEENSDGHKTTEPDLVFKVLRIGELEGEGELDAVGVEA